MTIAFAVQARARRIGALAAFVAIAVAGAARAQAPGEVVPYQPPAVPPAGATAWPPMMLPPPAAPPVKRWYGYQIMLTDLGSLLLAVSSRQTRYLGTMGLLAVPAVIHGVHHNTSMAIASPLLRVGLPVAGLLISRSATDCSTPGPDDDGTCGLQRNLIGAGLGLLTAMIIDYSQAFYEPELTYAPVPPTARRPPAGVTLAGAGVAPTANGATVLLGGTF
jgi:hypothetical protein